MSAWKPIHVVIDAAAIARGDLNEIVGPISFSADLGGDEREFESSLARFTMQQRALAAVLWYDGEVCNGGHNQYFGNSTGMSFLYAVAGLADIGRPDLRDILTSALSQFPGGASQSWETRGAELERLGLDFEEFDNRYYYSRGEIDNDLLTYIRRHEALFYCEGLAFMHSSSAGK